MKKLLRLLFIALCGFCADCQNVSDSDSSVRSRTNDSTKQALRPVRSGAASRRVSEWEIRELGPRAYDAVRNATADTGIERSDTLSIEIVTIMHLAAIELSEDGKRSATTEQVVVDFSLADRPYDAEVTFNQRTNDIISVRRIHKPLR